MNRRSFLINSARFLGILGGIHRYSDALAHISHPEKQNSSPGIALIIDDIGFSFQRTRQFLDLDIPLTFSILPRLKNSYPLAHEIHMHGHEIMLHQPMEPYNPDLDPGPGALYLRYETDQISNIMQRNIDELPFISGVNNHMGSKFTAHGNKITAALNVIKANHLFFVDSLTTSRSKAFQTARRMQLTTGCRSIFLDNIPDTSAILAQLYRLERRAHRFGRAIGIGHPLPETAAAIKQYVHAHSEADLSFVHVSKVLPGTL